MGKVTLAHMVPSAADGAGQGKSPGSTQARACYHCRRPLVLQRSTARYCSDACRKADHDRRRPARPSPPRCRKCRRVLPPKPISRLFCSASCRTGFDRIQKLGRRPRRRCPICKAPIKRPAPRFRRYCSVDCRTSAMMARRRRAQAETVKPVRHCQDCAKVLGPSRRADTLYCDENCRQRTLRKKERAEKMGRRIDRWCRECKDPIPAELRDGTIYCGHTCAARASKHGRILK